jgi:hypothetical protein|tara:strand:+ start:962 stop:1186 length:225 start_codon:yes stop_codon:yes gene_type:complete
MGGIFRKPKKRTPPAPPDPRREETAKKTSPDQKKEDIRGRTGTRGGLSQNFVPVDDNSPTSTLSVRDPLGGVRR